MNLLATIVKADPGTAQALLLAAAAIFLLAFVIEAVDKKRARRRLSAPPGWCWSLSALSGWPDPVDDGHTTPPAVVDVRRRDLALIGYPSPDGGSYPLYECGLCGAAVSAPGTHAEWHDGEAGR